MTQAIREVLRAAKLLACGLALSLLLGSPPTRAESDWGLSQKSSQAQIDATLDALARLPTLRANELDAALARLGFQHDMPALAWQSLSDKEQLTSAYRWASAAGGAENGDRLIAALARNYAKSYESIEFDPVFRKIFLSGSDPPEHIEFRKPTPSQLKEPLPREASQLIRQLATYVDGPGPLGRANIARKIFGLEGNALEDTLAERKPRDFLAAGSRRAGRPPPVYQRLNDLLLDVLAASEAAGADPNLAAVAAEFRKKFGNPSGRGAEATHSFLVDGNDRVVPDPTGNGPPANSASGGGPGPGTAERTARAEMLHRSFDANNYPKPGQMRYSSVRMRAGGRGGVIAGAEVTSDIGDARRIEFKSGAHVCGALGEEIPTGELIVVSSSGTYRVVDVKCDVFFAARRLTYEDLGVPLWKSGEAIGLASIDLGAKLTDTFPLFMPADSDLSKAGRRKGMLLHPALTDLDVGRAVALMDLWPTAASRIRLLTSGHPAVNAWLKQLEGAITWKWSDSPVRITAAKSELVVRPVAGTTVLSQIAFTRRDVVKEAAAVPEQRAAMVDSVRKSCLETGQSPSQCGLVSQVADLEFSRIATETDHGREITTLDAAVPVLARSISDFARVEELFRMLSVMRWAKASGAPLPSSNMQLATSRAATPDTVVAGVLGDYIAAAPRAGAWIQECKLFQSRLQKGLEQLKSEPDTVAKGRREVAWEMLADAMRADGMTTGKKEAPEFSCVKK